MTSMISVVIASFIVLSHVAWTTSGTVLSGAFLMAIGVSTINTSLGFYHRIQCLSRRQMQRRALAALLLSLPLAYAVYRLSPPPPNEETTSPSEATQP